MIDFLIASACAGIAGMALDGIIGVLNAYPNTGKNTDGKNDVGETASGNMGETETGNGHSGAGHVRQRQGLAGEIVRSDGTGGVLPEREIESIVSTDSGRNSDNVPEMPGTGVAAVDSETLRPHNDDTQSESDGRAASDA
jgi:hypothetical protein